MRRLKAILCVLGIILGTLAFLGLMIWLGFPTPEGFDRTPICWASGCVFVAIVVFCVVYLSYLGDTK